MDKIRKSLDEAIEKSIHEIKNMDTECDAKSNAIKDLSELYKLRIEEKKVDAEISEKDSQEKSRNYDRWINVGLQISLAALSLVAYNIWYTRGLKFEETGTVTSSMTRNLMSKMLPKK